MKWYSQRGNCFSLCTLDVSLSYSESHSEAEPHPEYNDSAKIVLCSSYSSVERFLSSYGNDGIAEHIELPPYRLLDSSDSVLFGSHHSLGRLPYGPILQTGIAGADGVVNVGSMHFVHHVIPGRMILWLDQFMLDASPCLHTSLQRVPLPNIAKPDPWFLD